MDDRPFAVTANPHGNRLHRPATRLTSVAGRNVDVLAPQAVRAMVSMARAKRVAAHGALASAAREAVAFVPTTPTAIARARARAMHQPGIVAIVIAVMLVKLVLVTQGNLRSTRRMRFEWRHSTHARWRPKHSDSQGTAAVRACVRREVETR